MPEGWPVRLVLAGDVMLGRLVSDTLERRHEYRWPWGDVLPILRAADLFFVNLECALTRRTDRWADGGYKPFYFRADPAAVKMLQLGRVDFASLANNHIGDFGAAGLRDTIATLDAAGIAHAGAGIDSLAARLPALLTRAGPRVAVVAFADYPEEWAATATTPGINYTPVSLEREYFDEVKVTLAVAREQADLVVFSIHWGPNMRERPSPEFQAFARAVIDAGADIFWGHSAHVVHGIEWWRGRPILYDTGDLVDDYAVDPDLRNDLSAVFLLTVASQAVRRIEVVPVQIAALQARMARGRERDWFLDRFRAHCAELGTDIIVEPGPVHIVAPATARA